MNRIILIIVVMFMRVIVVMLLMALVPVLTSAQNTFMVSENEGKECESLLSGARVWIMGYSSIYQIGRVSYVESKLSGDTIIGNVSFKRKYNREWKQDRASDSEWEATNYYVGQTGGKVYYYDAMESQGEPQLLMDFSVKKGEAIPYLLEHRLSYLTVVNVSDTVFTDSDDHRLRCIYVTDNENSVSDAWIEGVGSIEYGIEPYFMNRITGGIPKLLRCTEGDNVLYEHPDGAIIVGMSCPPAKQNAQDSAIYDLQGRRLAAKPEKGIYIQNGRKRF